MDVIGFDQSHERRRWNWEEVHTGENFDLNYIKNVARLFTEKQIFPEIAGLQWVLPLRGIYGLHNGLHEEEWALWWPHWLLPGNPIVIIIQSSMLGTLDRKREMRTVQRREHNSDFMGISFGQHFVMWADSKSLKCGWMRAGCYTFWSSGGRSREGKRSIRTVLPKTISPGLHFKVEFYDIVVVWSRLASEMNEDVDCTLCVLRALFGIFCHESWKGFIRFVTCPGQEEMIWLVNFIDRWNW